MGAKNKSKGVWADSAYYSEEKENWLKEEGYESRIISRYKKHLPLWSNQSRENTRRAKIRARVEHVFGFMENSMRGKMVRGVGLARVKAKLSLRNKGKPHCTAIEYLLTLCKSFCFLLRRLRLHRPVAPSRRPAAPTYRRPAACPYVVPLPDQVWEQDDKL